MTMLYWFYAAIVMHILTAGSTLATLLTGKKIWAYVSLIWGLSAVGFLYYFLYQFFGGVVGGFNNVGQAFSEVWGTLFQLMEKMGRT